MIYVFNYYKLQLFVEKFTIHGLSATNEWGIPELKKNYAHVILGPMEWSPRAV